LVTANFTQPFRDPIGYALDIVGLANKLGGGKPLIQRLGDLIDGRRSHSGKIGRWIKPSLKEAEPGDLRFAVPDRILENILEFLESLELVFPGLNNKDTLVYGMEPKFYSSRIELRKGFETASEGIFLAGDGSGYTRSISQAAAMGAKVAQALAEKLGKGKEKKTR
jgi:uncharacterized FAD-dependent dehydrogenase